MALPRLPLALLVAAALAACAAPSTAPDVTYTDAAAAPDAAPHSSPAPPPVDTREGPVVGFRDGGVDRYYGIPFAAPPVGDLRWRSPRPADRRDTTLFATAFSADPVSHNVWGDMRYRSPGFAEDCLYLNVWVPARDAASARAGLPVLLYFYGGGLIAGGASETRYDGAALAREGIVVVTANYRLNVFGRLAHPELSAEDPAGGSGNYAYRDQLAALRWVRDNIGAFGGDPAHITVGGESAGSISVSTLLANPAASELIAGAIGQSGAAVEPLYHPVPLAEAEAVGAAFAKTIGAPTLAALRALPADTLYARYLRWGGSLPLTFDGEAVTQTVEQAYARGDVPAIPLLAGWNSREAGVESITDGEPLTRARFERGVRERYPAVAAQLLSALDYDGPERLAATAQTIANDAWIAYPTWRWTEAHARLAGGPTYRYYYDHPRPGQTGGAPHAAEIPYALGNLDVHPAFAWTEADHATSATMSAYFANFVKTGNPNADGLPDWPPQTPGGRVQPVMRIAPQSELIRVDDAHRAVIARQYASAATN